MAFATSIQLWLGMPKIVRLFYQPTAHPIRGYMLRRHRPFPSGKEGEILTVRFTVAGVPCIGLNGGVAFKHNEAFSFQIAPMISKRPAATGTPLSAMEARRVCAGGARQVGRFPANHAALATGGGEARRAFDAMIQPMLGVPIQPFGPDGGL